MNILTTEEMIVGKTIKSTKMCDCWNKLAILFNDNTYAIISSQQHHDEEAEMTFINRPSLELLKEAGVISDAEYMNKVSKTKRKQIEKEQKVDLAEFNRLKEKLKL